LYHVEVLNRVGNKNLKKLKISLFEPFVGEKEVQEVSKVIKGKFWASGSGTGKVKDFENAFSKFVGCRDSVAVNSGTAALHLALSVLNVEKTEVIVPSITFASTAHAAVYNNAKPRFVDVDESTLCIDVDDLEKKISRKTSVIIPVHMGGYPCKLEQIKKLARDYKIRVVEDAAHACGASYQGKKIGSHSDMVCFSFHPVKNLSMPTGGLIAINSNLNTVKTLKSKRWCGISNRKGTSYDIDSLGWNYYMNEISAAIGIVQLKRLQKLNKRRVEIAKKYYQNLNVVEKMPFSKDCSYHIYWIRVKNRNDFMKKMFREGIETGIHYKPIHMMSYYQNKVKLPISEKIQKEIVSLPIHPNLKDEQVERVIQKVNSIIN
jgi:dTDP-4-amino-4,6-dideoxygalactose transaminase